MSLRLMLNMLRCCLQAIEINRPPLSKVGLQGVVFGISVNLPLDLLKL